MIPTRMPVACNGVHWASYFGASRYTGRDIRAILVCMLSFCWLFYNMSPLYFRSSGFAVNKCKPIRRGGGPHKGKILGSVREDEGGMYDEIILTMDATPREAELFASVPGDVRLR